LQLGAGQWRFDPVMLPFMGDGAQLAGNAGGGLELRLSEHAGAGLECLYTYRLRDGTDPTPHFLTTLLAFRASY
jgi:hypothetical protein